MKVVFVWCVVLVFVDTEALGRRDVSTQPPLVMFDALQKNIDQFRDCVDQSLARTVGELNEKQLQPLFTAISDHVGRIYKAFEDLTAPRSAQASPPAS